MSTPAPRGRRRRCGRLAARPPAPRSISRAWARSSSADRCTPSRSRTTVSSTWPTVRIVACRCSRRTGSTSRRCSSTAPVRRRSRPPGSRSRPTRSSSSSTSPTTATRTSRCSSERACELLYQFGQRSEKPGDFQGLHHLAIDSKGNIYTGEVAPGERAQRFVYKGLSNTLPPQRAFRGCRHQRRASVSAFPAPGQARGGYPPWTSTMANPYQMTPNWPRLGDIKPGAAIGIIPDGKGGTWLHHRSEPPILYIDRAGQRRSTASATACSCRRTASVRTATATSGRATAVRSQTVPRPRDVGFSSSSSAPTARCCCRSARPASRRLAPTRSSVRPRARLRRTATSSSPTGTGRDRPTRSRTAIGWCG